MKRLFRIIFFICIIKPFLIVFIGLRVYNRDNLPKHHPFIIIANHSSHLDAVSLLNLFPLGELHRIRPIAAADYFERNKIISIISKTFFNILSIERKHITRENNPLKQINDTLKSNQSIIVFPEGTRKSNGQISNFKSGIMHIIRDNPDISVIPVYMTNMWRSLPKGEWIPVPFFCEIIVGKSIRNSDIFEKGVEYLEKAMAQLSSFNE